MTLKYFHSFFLAVLVISSQSLRVQAQEGSQGPLFSSTEIIDLTIEADWRTVLSDRGEERDEHPATITFQNMGNATDSLPLQVRVRGNFRRQKKICQFPPIRLNFKKKGVKNTLFEGQDKLKLVTHCQTNRSKYEQFILQEYLIYKAYNLITDQSFRVRLARITYQPTGKGKPFTRYGFIIEDEDLMAERLNSKMLELSLHQEALEDHSITRLSLFQYLIGNTDWSVPVNHNLALLGHEETNALIAVPYDFDWSGLIDTPYAQPAEVLPIKKVTERLYRGYCRPLETLQPHLEMFMNRKPDLYHLFTSFEPLEKREKDRILNYLDAFYEVIENPRLIDREFMQSCRSLN